MADVKSTTGSIEFDVDSDQNFEMTLDNTGLMVTGNMSLDQLFLNSDPSHSTLSLNGVIAYSNQSVTSNESLGTDTMVLVDSSSGNLVLSMPYAGNVTGQMITIKKVTHENEIKLEASQNAFENFASNILINSTQNSETLPYINLISSDNLWWILASNANLSFDFWIPEDLNLELWLDAADESTVLRGSSANVYQWNDKSGNDRHATQSTAANQPSYQETDADANFQQSVNAGTQSGTIGVITPSITVNRIYVVTSFNGGGDSTFNGYNTLFSGPGANGQQRVMGEQNSADLHTVTGIYATTIYINGSTTNTGTVLPMPLSLLRIDGAETQTWGIGFNQGTSNRNWQGPMCEVIFTDATESLSDQQRIEGYLAWKWGIQSLLDASHPYKDSPP